MGRQADRQTDGKAAETHCCFPHLTLQKHSQLRVRACRYMPQQRSIVATQAGEGDMFVFDLRLNQAAAAELDEEDGGGKSEQQEGAAAPVCSPQLHLKGESL